VLPSKKRRKNVTQIEHIYMYSESIIAIVIITVKKKQQYVPLFIIMSSNIAVGTNGRKMQTKGYQKLETVTIGQKRRMEI